MTTLVKNSQKSKILRTSANNCKTILFNCECHTFEAVINQLMKALNCGHLKAGRLAYVAHNTGSVTVCSGSKEYCETVADVLGSIGLFVSVTC